MSAARRRSGNTVVDSGSIHACRGGRSGVLRWGSPSPGLSCTGPESPSPPWAYLRAGPPRGACVRRLIVGASYPRVSLPDTRDNPADWSRRSRRVERGRLLVEPTTVMIDPQTGRGGRAGPTFLNAGGQRGGRTSAPSASKEPRRVPSLARSRFCCLPPGAAARGAGCGTVQLVTDLRLMRPLRSTRDCCRLARRRSSRSRLPRGRRGPVGHVAGVRTSRAVSGTGLPDAGGPSITSRCGAPRGQAAPASEAS